MASRLCVLVALPFLLTACSDDGGGDGGETSTGAVSDESSSGGSMATSTTGSAETGADSTGSDGSSGSTGEGPTGYDDVYDIEGDEVFPEGVAFDPVDEAFLIGSLEDGIIRRVAVDGTQSDLATPSASEWSTSGLKVDGVNDRVWACGGDPAAGSRGAWIVDRVSGDEIEFIDFTQTDPESGCNDVALDADGVAYFSDPSLSAIVRVEVGGTPEQWATSEDWTPVGGLGVNGLAVTPDGAYLIVGYFTPPALYRVDMADPTDIVPIELSGDMFAGGAPIAGVDGVIFDDDALYVTFADVVKRVDFGDDWTTGTVSTFDVPDVGNGLSTAAEAGGAVYVVKSEVTAWVLNGDPELPFQIVRVPGT